MPDTYRRQCRALRLATLFVFAMLAALLAAGALGLPWWPGDSTDPAYRDQRLALFAAQALPALCYLWALWSVQRALGDLAAGRTFHPVVARAMRHIGFAVLAGSLAKVFVVINLTRWLLDARGSIAYFDMAAIVLGVVGAALVLLARLVDQARQVQAELDEIL